MSEPRNVVCVAASLRPRAVNPGSMTTAMIANPTQGSAPTFCDALYATIRGRKMNTHCHIRFTNCHDGGSSVRGSAQLPITPSVDISAMNVMNSDAPRSAPRIGRNESDRNSKSESSHGLVPRGPFARSRALMSSIVSPSAGTDPAPAPDITGNAMMSL